MVIIFLLKDGVIKMNGKIILNLAISLDGYIADENGGFEWIVGDGYNNYVKSLTTTSNCYLSLNSLLTILYTLSLLYVDLFTLNCLIV